MLHISCNIGTRDLPDMYALSPWALGIYTYQANHLCLYYNNCITVYVCVHVNVYMCAYVCVKNVCTFDECIKCTF